METKKIWENYDLTKLNTLGVHASAKKFIEVSSEQDLKELFEMPEFKKNKKIFLGGGSNVLFTKDFDGIVILNKLKGIAVLEENTASVLVRSMSGEPWHDLVNFTTDHGFWGIENLALIPGTVGGAPVQNIGAYGAELKDVLVKVEAYDIQNGEKKIFENGECEFGYRDSVFKSKLKGKYFISGIILRLSKIAKPNISYKILKDYLEENKIEVKNPKDVSDAVSAIRRSKLPDPNMIGNAGSFFKNVFVDEAKLQKLRKKFPDIKYFAEERDGKSKIKIPAAWLIEACGPAAGTSWKGYRVGSVGVHEKHALVLVNYGGGTGEEIAKLAKEIAVSVFAKFGLLLIPEVNFI